MKEVLALGRCLQCGQAWALTEHDNDAALALYATTGGEKQEQVMFSFRL